MVRIFLWNKFIRFLRAINLNNYPLSAVTSVSPASEWANAKTKIENTIIHLEEFLKFIVIDATKAIQENNESLKSVTVDSINAQIVFIDGVSVGNYLNNEYYKMYKCLQTLSLITAELAKSHTLEDKFFLENSALTLNLDKKHLNELLTQIKG